MTPITLSPTPHSIRVVAAARSLLYSHALAHTRAHSHVHILYNYICRGQSSGRPVSDRMFSRPCGPWFFCLSLAQFSAKKLHWMPAIAGAGLSRFLRSWPPTLKHIYIQCFFLGAAMPFFSRACVRAFR